MASQTGKNNNATTSEASAAPRTGISPGTGRTAAPSGSASHGGSASPGGEIGVARIAPSGQHGVARVEANMPAAADQMSAAPARRGHDSIAQPLGGAAPMAPMTPMTPIAPMAASKPKRRRRRRTGRYVALFLVLAAAAGGVYYFRSMDSGAQALQVSMTELVIGNLVDSVGTKGSVQSVMKRNVYAAVTLMVDKVLVGVGDRVEEGQELATLDTVELEMSIEQSRVELDLLQKGNDNSLASARQAYDAAVASLADGTNAAILQAQSAVKVAQANVDTAQMALDAARNDAGVASAEAALTQSQSAKMQAQSALTLAQIDVDSAQRSLDTNLELFDAGAVPQETVKQLESALEVSQSRLSDAERAVSDADRAITNAERGIREARSAVARAVEQAQASLNTARVSHDNAVDSLDVTQKTASQEIDRLRANLEAAELAANTESKEIALERLENQLEAATIRAPVSGTVTAVYARAGSPGTGLMFIIEDTDHLIVTTRVKEYDVGKVAPGARVSIKSDSTGDDEYYGVVSKIEPAAAKNQLGETDTFTDIEFNAEITVTSTDTNLKIGTNARLTIIADVKDDVFFVPYDAVLSDAESGSVIFAVEDDGKGVMGVRQVPVATGMETDFYIEIDSGELYEGMLVVSDASNAALREGTQVSLLSMVMLPTNSGGLFVGEAAASPIDGAGGDAGGGDLGGQAVPSGQATLGVQDLYDEQLALGAPSASEPEYRSFLPRYGTGQLIGFMPPAAFTAGHVAYIGGDLDGYFRPDEPMTRAEAASAVFNLLSDPTKDDPLPSLYDDVEATAPYCQASSYLKTIGAMNGHDDGLFWPQRTISRGQFCVVLASFDGALESGSSPFTDVSPDYWAAPYVASAGIKGWFDPGPGGVFRPTEPITRAEAVVALNRILYRGVEAGGLPEFASARAFVDVPASHWAYLDIMEASIGHGYTRQPNGYEVWAQVLGY